MADVTEEQALDALGYLVKLHLVRFHRRRSKADGDVIDSPAEYQITASGRREYERVKPIIYRREGVIAQ